MVQPAGFLRSHGRSPEDPGVRDRSETLHEIAGKSREGLTAGQIAELRLPWSQEPRRDARARSWGRFSMCVASCCGVRPPVVQQFTTSQSTGGGSTPSAAATGSQAGLGASALVSASSTALSHTITHSNGTTKTMFTRQVPEDRAKAANVVSQLMASTGRYADSNVAKAEGFTFLPPEGDLVHARNPHAKDGVNLNEPNMLLYRQTGSGLELIGAVLMSHGSAPDLGLGEWHVHDNSQEMMKHVWFTSNNLDAAFSETEPKA
jgi:hypothetical protein